MQNFRFHLLPYAFAGVPAAPRIFAPPRSYGGVVARPTIAAAADWYLYSIAPLIDALP